MWLLHNIHKWEKKKSVYTNYGHLQIIIITKSQIWVHMYTVGITFDTTILKISNDYVQYISCKKQFE